jgi:hypothetical protein
MKPHTTQMGAGTPAALPMLSSMLDSLLDLGSANRNPKARRKIIAVMPDGAERTIYKSAHSGWNLPDGCSFTSHLSSAKRAWMAAGATIKTINE